MNRPPDYLYVELAPAGQEGVLLDELAPQLSEEDRALLARPGEAPDQAAWQLWAARRNDRCVAALRSHAQPGGAVTLRYPVLVPHEPSETASRLIMAVVAALRRQNARRAQSLVADPAGVEASLWQACGFRHAADLVHMLSLPPTAAAEPASQSLSFVPWSAQLQPRFVQVVEQTYTGSLDCGSLEPTPANQALEGYRSLGKFDPARWLLARVGNADVGVLLLAEYPGENAWELVYMGVVPAWRGRGHGLRLVRHAQRLAAASDRSRLTLAVDAANVKALDVYEAAGFVEWNRRSIFVCEF